MITEVRKRNGEIVEFHKEKITRAIFKAAHACGGENYAQAEALSDEVMKIAEKQFPDKVPGHPGHSADHRQGLHREISGSRRKSGAASDPDPSEERRGPAHLLRRKAHQACRIRELHRYGLRHRHRQAVRSALLQDHRGQTHDRHPRDGGGGDLGHRNGSRRKSPAFAVLSQL